MFSHAKIIVATVFFALALTCCAQAPPASWVYSTYFGGSQQEAISAATRDANGNVYVTGATTSPNFPTTPGVYEPTYPGPSGYSAVFVSKFSASGSLIWSTFVGPGTYQFGGSTAIQVDAENNVYIAGIFQDPGFPTTPGLPNNGVVFIVKLNSTGSQLIYGALMGPYSLNSDPQLALGSNAEAFLVGNGPAGDCCNATQTGFIGSLGSYDVVWIAEINPAGTHLPWSVQIGGNGSNDAYGAAIDNLNKLYITGYTDAVNFPTTPGALDQGGSPRVFVMKLDPSRLPHGSLVYSALVGGPPNSPNDFIEPEAIAVDQAGNAYVGAWTYNIALFTSKWAFQPKPAAVPNAYVFELNSAGSAFLNGTYLGGSNADYVRQVAVDSAGNTYVSGFTDSWDFPTTAYGNISSTVLFDQGYYVKLNPQFAAVSSSVFGSTQDYADANAAIPDGVGGLWVAGDSAGQFPTTANAFQPTYQGNGDGILFHTDFAGQCSSNGVTLCPITADGNNPERIHFTSQAADAEGTVNIALATDGMPTYSAHAAQFDIWLPTAPGNHVARVLAQNVNGTQSQDEQSFGVTAQSTCPLNPLNLTLTFCSPLNAAVLKSPVTVVIQPNDTLTVPTVQLYVDGKLQASLSEQNGVFTYTMPLAPGIHYFNAQTTDGYTYFYDTNAVARVAQ